MNTQRWYIQTHEGMTDRLAKLAEKYSSDKELGEYGVILECRTGTITTRQMSAVHVYFGLLSKALNDAGLEIHMEFLGKSIEVPWDAGSVKERIWRPLMKTMTGKTSTTKIDRKDVSEIYEVLHRHFATTHGINVPFPVNKERR